MTDRRQVLQAAVLIAAGVTVLPGCASEDAPVESAPTANPGQTAELTLIAAYDAALLTARPAQRAALQAIREDHVAHLRALGWDQLPEPTPADSRTTAQLIRAERRAARSRTQEAREVDDPDQAQLLALIAASEHQHIVTLENL